MQHPSPDSKERLRGLVSWSVSWMAQLEPSIAVEGARVGRYFLDWVALHDLSQSVVSGKHSWSNLHCQEVLD